MSSPHPTPAPLDLAQFEGFTPGPWSALPEGRYKGSIWVEVRRDGYKTGIAEVMLTPAEVHGGTKEANALLIAAAPALLAECQRQRAEIERLRVEIAGMRAALEGTIQPMILLGDFIGNDFAGKVGIPAFDRCAAIGAARKALLTPAPAVDPTYAEVVRLRTALERIARGEGRYSTDRLTHANNTIEDMQEAARAALSGQEGQ